MKDKQLLIDNFVFVPSLIEDKRKEGGKVIARGEFARADLATENKRVYTRALWERELKRLARALDERKVYGELDHPADGRTMLKRASHILTGLRLENGVVVGEAEILDTQEGKNLKAILDAGGAVGVSSRGFGTTRPNQEGMDVVQDDYRLMTFDFVADPANVTSYPSIHIEDKEPLKTEKIMVEKQTLESLRQSNPKLYENLRDEAEREFEKRGAEIWAKKIMAAKVEASTDLKSVFAENLKAAIEAAKSEAEATVRAQLMADPTVAGAKTALENLKAILRPYIMPEDVAAVVAAKDGEIAALNAKIADVELKNANLATENSELASVAKEAGYKYHLETLLRGIPHSDLIRKTIGDVKQFESVEALNAKVSDIVDEIKKVSDKQESRDREIEQLKEQNEKFRLAAEKALEATKVMSVMAYVEERLRNHPKASQVRTLIESVQPESRDAVDEILSKFRDKARDKAQLEEARARVKTWVGSNTVEYLKESEEPSNKGTNQTNFNGLGVSADALRALSGMGSEEN